MADGFWDFELGDDLNSGTMDYPWRTFAGAAAAAFLLGTGTGDRAFLANTYRPTTAAQLNSWVYPVLSGVNLFAFQQWEGRGQAVLRGDAPLTGAVWTNVSGDIWTTTLPAGLGSPTGMTIDYDVDTWTGFSSETLNMGVCDAQANDAAVDATPWSFRYVTATGVCRLHCPGRDPNVSTVTMVRAGTGSLMGFTNCIECSATGIDFRLTGINTSGGGYGHSGDTCNGCTLDSCRFYDLGAHSMAWIGTSNQYNVVRSCKAFGCAANSTQYVTFLNHATNAIEGGLFVDSVAHVVGYRDGSNEDVNAPVTMQGFFGHCSSGGLIEDLEFRRCMGYVYMPTAGDAVAADKMHAYGLTNAGTFTGAWNDRTGRKIRYIECSSRNDCTLGGLDGTSGGAASYYLRCSFHFTKAGATLPAQHGVILANGGGGVTVQVLALFEACELIANLQRSSGTESFVRLFTGTFTAGESVNFIGCDLLNVGAGSNTCLMVDYNSKANCTIRMYAGQMGHVNRSNATSYMCGGDGAISAAFHEFRSNLYLNTNQTTFEMSANASFDTWAEWIANVDTSNAKRVLNTALMRYADITVSGQVLPGSEARASIAPSEVPVSGFNGTPFSGDYGCYQYPPLVGKSGMSSGLALGL